MWLCKFFKNWYRKPKINMIDNKIYEEAKMYAIRMHGLQDYDGFPYHKHLQDVESVLRKFGYIKLIVPGWLHDVLEDAPVSYNDIKKHFGIEVAEIVYCVTDELGRNRKERKVKTLPKIKSNPYAIIIKLADRIANVEHSIKHNSRMFLMYEKEYNEFKKALQIEGHADEMWMYLDKLFENKLKQL